MLAALAGLVLGAVVAFAAIYEIWKVYYTQASQDLDLAVVISVIGGGTIAVLGGYLGMLLAAKSQKRRRSKSRGQTAGPQFVPRKKRK
jgi:hypothetical protein